MVKPSVLSAAEMFTGPLVLDDASGVEGGGVNATFEDGVAGGPGLAEMPLVSGKPAGRLCQSRLGQTLHCGSDCMR